MSTVTRKMAQEFAEAVHPCVTRVWARRVHLVVTEQAYRTRRGLVRDVGSTLCGRYTNLPTVSEEPGEVKQCLACYDFAWRRT